MMTTQQDPVTVERLAEAFNRCFELSGTDPDIFADDVFFDLYPPFWRFQLQGGDAFHAQLKEIAEGAAPQVRALRVVPTASGFVLEHEESGGPRAEVARRMWLCEVRDGRITDVVGYCNGGWNAELRARQAAEAPMLRP
jgi:hypothetical protein